MRAERDEGMRLRFLLTLLMMLRAQPCPPRFGAMEVQGGWFCGGEAQFGSCCISDVHGLAVW